MENPSQKASKQTSKRFHKTREIIKKIPAQKPHIDFIAALLTIPVLLTAIILNFNSLQGRKLSSTLTPTPSVSKTPTIKKTSTFSIPSPVQINSTPLPTTDPNQCKKDIGPIDITFPQEGQTVSDNPVCINISYSGDGYCAVVWAYKINDGSLSDYANNSACLYNVPSGDNTFTLQVKSLVSNNTKTITRHFVYKSNIVQASPTSAPSTSASSSAGMH